MLYISRVPEGNFHVVQSLILNNYKKNKSKPNAKLYSLNNFVVSSSENLGIVIGDKTITIDFNS